MTRLPAISLNTIPLLLEHLSWMAKSGKPHLQAVYKALRVSEDERMRLVLRVAELEGREGETCWKTRVKK